MAEVVEPGAGFDFEVVEVVLDLTRGDFAHGELKGLGEVGEAPAEVVDVFVAAVDAEFGGDELIDHLLDGDQRGIEGAFGEEEFDGLGEGATGREFDFAAT